MQQKEPQYSGQAYLKVDSTLFDEELAKLAGNQLAEKILASHRSVSRRNLEEAQEFLKSLSRIDVAITSRRDRLDLAENGSTRGVSMDNFVNWTLGRMSERLSESSLGDFRTCPDRVTTVEYDDIDSDSGWIGDENVIKAAKQPAVFSLDPQTGSRIQHLLFAVQSVEIDSRAHVPALVVHARPAGIDSWRVVQNSFEQKIFAAWTSYLPHNTTPLQDELKVLDDYMNHGNMRGELGGFINERLRICHQPESIDGDTPLFWGSKSGDPLTRHALPGDEIRGLATFAAVGSAMQKSRVDAERAGRPGSLKFDMVRMFRSYYDCLILCSFLRWLRPGEQWWGTDAEACEAFTNALTRMESSQREISRYRGILLAEGLLAAKQGKMGGELTELLRNEAALARNQFSDETESAIGDVVRALDAGLWLTDEVTVR